LPEPPDFPAETALDAGADEASKRNGGEDTADLRHPEPPRFNRFSNPARHNAVPTTFMTCQVQPL
jgi:hypothetical protein